MRNKWTSLEVLPKVVPLAYQALHLGLLDKVLGRFLRGFLDFCFHVL